MNRSYHAINFHRDPAPKAGALLILPYSTPAECRYFFEKGIDVQALKVIAVDGGLEPTLAAGLVPDVWIGDGDSTTPTSEIPESVTQIVLPTDKNISDLEFAMHWIVDQAIQRAHIIGLWGGRPDHSLVNHGVLAANTASFSAGLSASASHCIYVYTHERGISSVAVQFPIGSTFSIVALSRGTVISVSGAKWELNNEKLSSSSHGLSNVSVAPSVCLKVTSGSAVMIGPFTEND